MMCNRTGEFDATGRGYRDEMQTRRGRRIVADKVYINACRSRGASGSPASLLLAAFDLPHEDLQLFDMRRR
jgi:hypothetical protein